jgi:hypothetical protein
LSLSRHSDPAKTGHVHVTIKLQPLCNSLKYLIGAQRGPTHLPLLCYTSTLPQCWPWQHDTLSCNQLAWSLERPCQHLRAIHTLYLDFPLIFIDLLTIDSTSFRTKKPSVDTSSPYSPPTLQLPKSHWAQAPLSRQLQTRSKKTPNSQTSSKQSLPNMPTMTPKLSLKPRLWHLQEAAASVF